MVRKRKKHQDEEQEIWCFYCDRVFNDEANLVLHQKNKHFKCSVCNKRLSNPQSLAVHAMQVHKITIQEIPDAKPGREDIKWEIYGSSGIPPGMQRGQDPPKQPAIGAAPAPAVHPGMPPIPMPYPPPHMGIPPRMPYGAPPPPFPGAPHRPPLPPAPHPHFPYHGPPPVAPYPPGVRPPVPPPLPFGSPYVPVPPVPTIHAVPVSTVPTIQTVPVPLVSSHSTPIAPTPKPTETSTPSVITQPPQQTTAKEKNQKLVWEDNETSMEERRASLSKYSVKIVTS